MEVIREGADITAEDMIAPMEEPSQIIPFFESSKLFIIGVTSFLGKMILEKILRTCPNIHEIYLLVREKDGKTPEERVKEVFDGPDFDTIHRKFPNSEEKIIVVEGNVESKNLGLTKENLEKIIQNVNVIIHCSALVYKSCDFKTTFNINNRSVKDMLDIAKRIKDIKSILFVSNAYGNFHKYQVEEKFYKPPISEKNLFSIIESTDFKKVNNITPSLLGKYPNSNLFTISVAENIVKDESHNLPIGILRPSMVIAAEKEPLVGWINHGNGPTGVLLNSTLGLLRTLYGNKHKHIDIVPADFVVSCILAATWDIATLKSINENQEYFYNKRDAKYGLEIPIYNIVSSSENRLSWDAFVSLAEKHTPSVASVKIKWHYLFKIRSNRKMHIFVSIFHELLPAYFLDMVCRIFGQKPQLVNKYKQIYKLKHSLAYYTQRQWDFKNENVVELWKKMADSDKRIFEFDMSAISWSPYFSIYVRGIRVYLLKDPLETIPMGVIKYYKMMVLHYILLLFFIYLLLRIFVVLFLIF